MGQTICVFSQKGGVGKTTTAINLSASLAIAEKKALLVDCDPQGHATVGMGIAKNKLKASLYHAMAGKVTAEELVTDGLLGSLKLLPARIELTRAEVELAVRPNKEQILEILLKDLKKSFDYIIIDCPPSFGLLTVNAIAASEWVLIPLQCDFYALEGLEDLFRILKIFKKNFNRRIQIIGILLTMFEATERMTAQIADEARRCFRGLVFKTVIPRNVHLRESAIHGRPVLLNNIASTGAQRYLKLAKECMDRLSVEPE